MKLAGAEWRILTSDVAVDGRAFRVVQPARPARHAPLYEGHRGAQMLVDKPAAVELAAAWWLAARSPRTVVWLPLRRSAATCGSDCYDKRLDLVLMHHSVALPVSAWKRVRAQTRHPRPQTVTLPVRPFREVTEAEHDESRHLEFQDHLRFTVAAQTLFLTGSKIAFDLRAEQLRGLVEDCPAHMGANPATHCCAEIGLGHGSGVWPGNGRNPWGELHVEYCADHR